MFLGTVAGIVGIADIIYLIKTIKRFRQLSKAIKLLQLSQLLDVSDVHKILEQEPIGTKMPVIIRGIIKSVQSKASQILQRRIVETQKSLTKMTKNITNKSDAENILSIITQLPINKSDQLQQYLYQHIPYRDVIKKATYMRPSDPTKIMLNIQDLHLNGTRILIQGCKNSDISGILSQVKTFDIKNIEAKGITHIINKVIIAFKSFLNSIMFLSPFKFNNKIGQKVSYYGIMKDSFGYVVGDAKKKTNGQIVIQNPKFVTKQIGFIINRLKQNKKIYKYLLIIFIIAQLIALYYLFKWLKRGYNLNIRIRGMQEQPEQQVDENIPFYQSCIVCYSNPRSVIFKPCKHYGLCYECYKKVGKSKNCPVCKQQIEGIIRVIKK